jgi:CheY-like chemotaxis protein
MTESAVAECSQVDHSVWKILVVDDEPAIHQVTKLALRNLSVLGRPSQLINALSAKDAREQLEQNPDIAVVLLDVVMETEDAGLEFIKHIRQQAANPLIRIILRTGQPGQAPERQVMVDYDINDYKEKTELTASKLFTTVMSSIRTFGHLQSMECCQRGMEVLGRLNTGLFAATDATALAHTLVEQLQSLRLFTHVACWQGQADAPLISSGLPAGASGQAEILRWAQAAPGTLMQQDALYAVTLAPATGAALSLCLSAELALEPRSQQLLELWVQSAGCAMAHWTTKA